jgi:hypothetical protein
LSLERPFRTGHTWREKTVIISPCSKFLLNLDNNPDFAGVRAMYGGFAVTAALSRGLLEELYYLLIKPKGV